MRPRKYIDRIEVWQNEAVPDGFGGNTFTSTKLGDSFCNIRTIPVEKLETFGLSELQFSIQITLRKRNDIDYNDSEIFFKYKGRDYFPNRITETDLNGYEFIIIASGNGKGT